MISLLLGWLISKKRYVSHMLFCEKHLNKLLSLKVYFDASVICDSSHSWSHRDYTFCSIFFFKVFQTTRSIHLRHRNQYSHISARTFRFPRFAPRLVLRKIWTTVSWCEIN